MADRCHMTTADPVLLAILQCVAEYRPALCCVSRRWQRIAATLATPPLRPSDLAARGHADLLEQCIARVGADFERAMRFAARGGHADIVAQCKAWG